ncbi:MAG: hypothetical protein VB875_11680, partial [Pirellulales bacterium]
TKRYVTGRKVFEVFAASSGRQTAQDTREHQRTFQRCNVWGVYVCVTDRVDTSHGGSGYTSH